METAPTVEAVADSSVFALPVDQFVPHHQPGHHHTVVPGHGPGFRGRTVEVDHCEVLQLLDDSWVQSPWTQCWPALSWAVLLVLSPPQTLPPPCMRRPVTACS